MSTPAESSPDPCPCCGRRRLKGAAPAGAPGAEVLRELYVAQDLSSTQLGKRFGVHPATAMRWIRRHGIRKEPRPKPPPAPPPPPPPPPRPARDPPGWSVRAALDAAAERYERADARLATADARSHPEARRERDRAAHALALLLQRHHAVARRGPRIYWSSLGELHKGRSHSRNYSRDHGDGER